MRISDWSSDVCSSDLRRLFLRRLLASLWWRPQARGVSMLRLENVVKSFGGVVATDHVSLEFPAGSLSAVIGPNGAGKTTLFNLITGHLVPDSGRILLGEIGRAHV